MATFNFTYAAGMTVQQALGFEIAGRIWGQYLTNDVTLNVHVGVDASLSNTKTLGGAIPAIAANVKYESFSKDLSTQASSIQEQTVVDRLRGKDYNFSRGEGSSADHLADRIDVTRANGKALNIIKKDDKKLDGHILLSTLGGTTGATWSYDYARTGTIGSNQVDFLSTAIHELGHILGFVSSVDRDRDNSKPSYLMPLDLFRGAMGNGATDYSRRDVAYGKDSVFFADRLAGTIVGNFAKGADRTRGGDGAQTSHWVEGQGLMDAFLSKGERASITNRELQAFDLLGWSIGGTQPNLGAIQSQAQSALAAQLGWSVTQLNASLGTSPTTLASDQYKALGTMLTDSEVYNWGRGSTTPPPPTPQELAQLMAAYGLAETIADPVEMLLEQVSRSATEFATQTGTDGIDRLTGGRGDDLLVGNNGDDRLSGGKGNDVLWGGQGDDQLWGGKGNDVLCGGAGNDRLWGGKGRDSFVLEASGGFDVVEDFRDGQDVIRLSSGLEFGQLSIGQQGRDTVIQFEGQSLMLLSNVRADRITAADFLA
jgi:Ca2+-binding RTX toxin-like protein